MIVEVSQKQNYIFASRKLKDNVARSQQIRLVTESTFFRETAVELYNEAENLVYSGGGHAVLQFSDESAATAFAKAISGRVLRLYPEIELYLRQIPYEPELSPKENLKKLSSELEKKKSLRKASFRWLSLGVEELNTERWRPEPEQLSDTVSKMTEQIAPPEGMIYPLEFDQMIKQLGSHGRGQRDESFLAVVHIDGNAMGRRVESLLENVTNWEQAGDLLRCFSRSVDEDYNAAFRETVERLLNCRPELREHKVLPIRPVIMAGDDVCFVTAGKIGLECARFFLEALTSRINVGDGKDYAACAGVALVHHKYPFHMAYHLSEELCSSAKCFSHSLDADGSVSAMDWHIEFGGLKNGLREIREDYTTEDGNRLELRPVAVVVPSGDLPMTVDPTRTYSYYRGLCGALQADCGRIARGKLKNLRTALKQGETETRFYLADKQISDLLYHPFNAKYQSVDSYREALKQMFDMRVTEAKDVFADVDGDGIKRSLFFDALEMLDHFEPLEEVTTLA